MMKDIYKKDTGYESYVTKDYKEYLKFIKLVLKNTDKVCFTVNPFLDNMEEFRQSKWGFLSDSVLYTICDKAITEYFDVKSHLIILKNDYSVYEFFLNKKNISDFEEDENIGITIEDPVFIKGNEVVCYALTHEDDCCIEKELYLQLEKSI